MLAIDPPLLGGSIKLQDIKKSMKESRRKKYFLLSDFAYDLYMEKTSKSISKIFTENIVTDSKICVRIASKIFVYMKLRREYFSNFFSTLENLIPNDESAIVTCSYVQSKLMKIIPRNNLKKIFARLINKQKNFPVNLAYFAYIMLKESFSSAIFCIHELIDLLSQLIYNSDQKVRLIAFDSLNMALKFLKSTSNSDTDQIIMNLFFQAKSKMSSNVFHEQHGMFLILAAVFQNLPRQIESESFEILNFFISALELPNMHSISLYNIVLLSRYDKESFLQNHYNSIFDILYNDNTSNEVDFLISYCFLIYYVTFSDQMISNEQKLTEILDSLIKHKETIKNAYQVINHISNNHSFFIQKNEQFFMSLFQKSIPLIGEIIHEYVSLIHLFPDCFDFNVLSQLILTKIEKDQSSFSFIEFLSFCPNLHNSKIEDILISMLSNQNLDLDKRSMIPSALLKQLSYDDRNFVSSIFQKIFQLALSDRNPLNRLSIIEAFNTDECYKYLTLPIHLDSLMKLVHDESIEVRKSAILLLGKILIFDPFDVNVILRKILLEHMFSIDMKNFKRIKSNIVCTIVPLIKSSKEIFPLYCSTFCDIALRELSNTPTEKMTYFEQKFSNTILKNIIKSIRFIAKTEIALLKSHLKQFVTFFIWQIQQEIDKEIKLYIIETLYIILTNADLIDGIDLSQLNNSLMEFASKNNSTKINCAVLKLVGFIGFSCKKIKTETDNTNNNLLPNDPSYFISCVCQPLFQILNNSNLILYHITCLKALSIIFANDIQMSRQSYFSKFITIVIEQIQLNPHSFDFIDILNHICLYSPSLWVFKYKTEIINLAQEMLEKKEENILNFIPTLCNVFKRQAGTFYQNGISLLYDILDKNMKKEECIVTSLKCMNSIISMKCVSDNFYAINVPKLLHILEKEKVAKFVKYKIIDSFSFLFQQYDINMSNFLPTIVRSLYDLLVKSDNKNDQCFIEKIMQTIYSMMIKNRPDFNFFENQITSLINLLKNISTDDKSNYYSILNKSPPFSFIDFKFIKIQSVDDFQNIRSQKNLVKNEKDSKAIISNENFAKLIDKSNTNIVNDDESKPINDIEQVKLNDSNKTENSLMMQIQSNTDEEINKIIDEEVIQKAVSIEGKEMEDWNWNEWYNNLVSTFIQFSPSPFISACSFLCENLFSIAESIFQPAFLSTWIFLTENARFFIATSFTDLLQSDSLPNHVCSSIISLIEFLERKECPIMISMQIICQACEKFSLHTNSFYFAYKWIVDEPFNIEANKNLVRILAYFGQTRMKKGLVEAIRQKKIDTSNSPDLFEFIGDWSKAGKMYEKQSCIDNFPKILKCLLKEQKWNEILDKTNIFKQIENKQISSKYILIALYQYKKWEEIKEILPFCPKNSIKVLIITSLFYNSQGRKKEALEIIDKAFNLLASKSKGMIIQDQTLIDKIIIKSQQLHEAFEIIIDDKKIGKIWEKRIENLPESYEFYYKILSVRLNKMTVESNQKYILKMLKFALKKEQFQQFYSTLSYFFPDSSKWPANVAFLHCKSVWLTGLKTEAIEKIDSILKDPFYVSQIESDQSLKCKMYCMYAEWLFSKSSFNSIFFSLKQAVDLLEISMRTKIRLYKPYYYWACSCSLMYMKANNVKHHAVSAIHGFLECIKINQETPFNDLIQMISLFFRVKFEDKSFDEISQRIGMLNDELFLLIIPQLFAQISSSQKAPQSLFIANIIMKILPEHYHVLLNNLLFDREPNEIISNICNWFSKKNPKAFNEGMTIKKGLVLCSSSSTEYWQIEITKSISAIQKKNWRLAVETLSKAVSKPLQPGESEKEEEFRSKIHQILTVIMVNFKKSAHISANDIPSNSTSQTVKKSKSDTDLKKQSEANNANSKDKNSIVIETIQQLRKAHSNIKDYLYSIQYLSMFNVAPELFLLRNSIVAVPGTYEPHQPKIFIKQFDPTLEIYNSKQRPRFLVIYGDDGSRHKSLLKGREDLRLDSRLMQFFMLINHHICRKKDQSKAKIYRYSITPITKNCGLIQFVDGADTIFSLITEYRRMHSTNIFIEQTIESSFSILNIDSLRPIQRVEALREASLLTKDDDLRKMIWIQSNSSQILMEKTSMFSESSAVMSIVGYILGIGDRHPSNILIHRSSGKVIHIDFGDCFEAAKRRKFFPELIPFRLTRMMVKAFGPSEIEGGFRIICERALNLLRRHVYTLMSVLDIFLIEPIDDPFNSDPRKSVFMKKKEKNELELKIDDLDNNNVVNSYNYEEEDNEQNSSPDIKDLIKRVSEKIVGKDIDLVNESNDNNDFYSIEDHVSFLIRNATDEYNLARLYHGWTPLW